MDSQNLARMSVSATLHCLLGCSIGEIVGMLLGAGFGWSNGLTFVVSIILAFVTGYSLSIRPLLKAGLPFSRAFPIILAADSLSIAAMETADNTVIGLIPGAMAAGLNNKLFWLTMPLSLLAGFIVAVPVNYALLKRGKGHALVHEFHYGPDGHSEHHDH